MPRLRPILLPLFLVLLLGRAQADPAPLRIGVAGLVHGHVGGFLGSALQRPDIKIVGIAEGNAAVAASYRDRYQLAPGMFYPTVDAMLDAQHPEAVVIYTATVEHRAVVESCARRGIPVMMEKPLAFTVTDASAMAAAARAGHIQVLVNYETTWYPSNQGAYAVAHQPGFGEIRKMVAHDGHRGPREIGVQPEFLAWLTDPAKNGDGALTDFGCYGANLMTWLMDNQRPVAVTAVAQQFKPDVYPRVSDEATIILTYPHAQGIIQASWNWPFDRKDLEVYGATGAATTIGRDTLRSHLPRQAETTAPAAPLTTPADDPIRYFTAVVRGQVQPSGLSSLNNNLVVVEILDAAARSAKTGQTVSLPLQAQPVP